MERLIRLWIAQKAEKVGDVGAKKYRVRRLDDTAARTCNGCPPTQEDLNVSDWRRSDVSVGTVDVHRGACLGARKDHHLSHVRLGDVWVCVENQAARRLRSLGEESTGDVEDLPVAVGDKLLCERRGVCCEGGH